MPVDSINEIGRMRDSALRRAAIAAKLVRVAGLECERMAEFAFAVLQQSSSSAFTPRTEFQFDGGTRAAERCRSATSAELLAFAGRRLQTARERGHVAMTRLLEAYQHRTLADELGDSIRAGQETRGWRKPRT